MTELEAIKKLNELSSGDPEVSHTQADDIVLEFLRSNGHHELVDAWEEAEARIGFWYA